MSVHKSPLALKQRVGISRTYVRPMQRDLDLTPLSDEENVVCQYVYILSQGLLYM